MRMWMGMRMGRGFGGGDGVKRREDSTSNAMEP